MDAIIQTLKNNNDTLGTSINDKIAELAQINNEFRTRLMRELQGLFGLIEQLRRSDVGNIQNIKNELEGKKRELEQNQTKLKTLTDENGTLRTEIDAKNKEIEGLRGRISALEQDLRQLQSQLEQNAKQLQECNDKLQNETTVNNDLRKEIERLNGERAEINKTIQDLQGQLDKCVNDKGAIDREIESMRQKETVYVQQLTELNQKIMDNMQKMQQILADANLPNESSELITRISQMVQEILSNLQPGVVNAVAAPAPAPVGGPVPAPAPGRIDGPWANESLRNTKIGFTVNGNLMRLTPLNIVDSIIQNKINSSNKSIDKQQYRNLINRIKSANDMDTIRTIISPLLGSNTSEDNIVIKGGSHHRITKKRRMRRQRGGYTYNSRSSSSPSPSSSSVSSRSSSSVSKKRRSDKRYSKRQTKRFGKN
jgi:predicted  nucleic acid-binding Zn-ribbon protein